MEETKTRVVDFRHVKVTDLEGNETTIDASKNLGNFLYQITGDIGVFEFARTVYSKGKADVEPVKVGIISCLNDHRNPFTILLRNKLIALVSGIEDQ